jgi:hypothetical protein
LLTILQYVLLLFHFARFHYFNARAKFLPTLLVYSYMISSIPIAASTYLNQYQGLLLSCRQVYIEFEAEALKNIDIFFKRLQSKTPNMLEVPKFEKLAHTVVRVKMWNVYDWSSCYDYLDGSSVSIEWPSYNVEDFFWIVECYLQSRLGRLQVHAGRIV